MSKTAYVLWLSACALTTLLTIATVIIMIFNFAFFHDENNSGVLIVIILGPIIIAGNLLIAFGPFLPIVRFLSYAQIICWTIIVALYATTLL